MTLSLLNAAAARIDATVVALQASGTAVDLIAACVSDLHDGLFAQAWALIAPPELQRDSCLLVMGSEGRGEQLLKTDQDNALILRDGVTFNGLAETAQAFSDVLADFGYPPCPGQIMLSNPLWRQPLAALRANMRDWLLGGDPEGPMRLAIFCDAQAVAGDASLLTAARVQVEDLVSDNDAYLARFAAAADQFDEPRFWFARLTGRADEQPLDLKKLGVFPIVHGVRSLALQHRVHERGTWGRMRALVERGGVDATLAQDALQALRCLMAVRLSHQLRQRAADESASNEVIPAQLAADERQALREALTVVKRWRHFLRQHFRLDTL
jgi:CBS domain-containing protein